MPQCSVHVLTNSCVYDHRKFYEIKATRKCNVLILQNLFHIEINVHFDIQDDCIIIFIWQNLINHNLDWSKINDSNVNVRYPGNLMESK